LQRAIEITGGNIRDWAAKKDGDDLIEFEGAKRQTLSIGAAR
jgi:hypothetical protein